MQRSTVQNALVSAFPRCSEHARCEIVQTIAASTTHFPLVQSGIIYSNSALGDPAPMELVRLTSPSSIVQVGPGAESYQMVAPPFNIRIYFLLKAEAQLFSPGNRRQTLFFASSHFVITRHRPFISRFRRWSHGVLFTIVQLSILFGFAEACHLKRRIALGSIAANISRWRNCIENQNRFPSLI
jgi:hypothetical protein